MMTEGSKRNGVKDYPKTPKPDPPPRPTTPPSRQSNLFQSAPLSANNQQGNSMGNFSQDQKALAHIIKMEIYFAENRVASAGSETRLASAVGSREGLKKLAQLFAEKTEINKDAFLKECGIGKEHDSNPYC